jgi:PadR family transcriptional regulator, regulatory protein AphA
METPVEEVQLTATSYIVLALVAEAGQVTPYGLKSMVADGLAELWPLQHAQVYAQPERLARAGCLVEHREQDGRRRRLYSLTDRGRALHDEWLATPTSRMTELRDHGLLRLYFGADPAVLGTDQAAAHEAKLLQYERQLDEARQFLSPGRRLTLEAGIEHERVWVDFWTRLSASGQV